MFTQIYVIIKPQWVQRLVCNDLIVIDNKPTGIYLNKIWWKNKIKMLVSKFSLTSGKQIMRFFNSVFSIQTDDSGFWKWRKVADLEIYKKCEYCLVAWWNYNPGTFSSLSTHCNLFEDRVHVPVNEIYEYLIFKWVAVTSIHESLYKKSGACFTKPLQITWLIYKKNCFVCDVKHKHHFTIKLCICSDSFAIRNKAKFAVIKTAYIQFITYKVLQ